MSSSWEQSANVVIMHMIMLIFFILPLFICLYHGLQDFQCGWHGVGLQTRLAEKRCNAASSEMNSGRVWSHPKSCLSPRPPTFLHKRYEMRRSFNIFSIFCFLKMSSSKTSTSHISNPCNLIPLLHPKNGSRHGPGTGEECFVKTGSSFYWLFIGARDGERTLRHLLRKEAAG